MRYHFFSALWMVFPESWKRNCPNFYAHDCIANYYVCILYYFYFQQKEMLNARGTTLLLGLKFESNKVLDVLFQYFAQIIGHFQLPMSIDLFKLIKIITAEDESKLSLAIVNSTNQIRAKCAYKLEDMRSLLKDNLQQWEFVQDSKLGVCKMHSRQSKGKVGKVG